jgi:hypothetical protein
MTLDDPKLLITLILQNFGKQRHLMTVSEMRLHALDDAGGPLNDQRLQTILLIEIRVHKLLHSFAGQLVGAASFIELGFLAVNICDGLL